jgi:hypothetical protein
LRLGRDLNDNTNDVEEGRARNRPLSAKTVADPSRGKTADERTDAEEPDDGTLARRAELAVFAEAREKVGHGEETYSPVRTYMAAASEAEKKSAPEIWPDS